MEYQDLAVKADTESDAQLRLLYVFAFGAS